MTYYRGEDRQYSLSGFPTVALSALVCLACWAVTYIYTSDYQALFLHDNKALVYVLGCLTLIISALMLQNLVSLEALIRERTQTPFILFLLLCSVSVGLQPLNSNMISMLLLLCSIVELFGSYQAPEETGKVFKSGVYIAIASVFTHKALLLLPLLWFGMYQFSLNLKSFSASLSGVLLVFLAVLTWSVWKHDYGLCGGMWAELTAFSVLRFADVPYILLLEIVFLLLSYAFLRIDAFNNSVRVRMMRSFFVSMSLWSLLLLLLYSEEEQLFMLLLVIPASVLLSCLFNGIGQRLRFAVYFLFLLLSTSLFLLAHGFFD